MHWPNLFIPGKQIESHIPAVSQISASQTFIKLDIHKNMSRLPSTSLQLGSLGFPGKRIWALFLPLIAWHRLTAWLSCLAPHHVLLHPDICSVSAARQDIASHVMHMHTPTSIMSTTRSVILCASMQEAALPVSCRLVLRTSESGCLWLPALAEETQPGHARHKC